MTKRIYFLSTIGIFIFGSLLATGQEGAATDSRPLSIEIKARKTCYRLQDRITFSMIVKNEGAVPIFLYRPEGGNSLPGLRALLFDPEGNLLGETDPSGRSPFRLAELGDFVELGPGDSLKEKASFTLSSRGAKNEVEYYVRALYESPISPAAAPNVMAGKKVWSFEDGDIYSSKFRINTVSDCKE